MDTPNKDFEQFKQAIHFSNDELTKIDDAIMAFMDAHPLPAQKEQSVSLMNQAHKRIIALFGRRMAYAALSLTVLFSTGVGTVFASNNALPGDSLYGVKVNVSEELRSMFLFNEVKEAQWETERLQRRLSELQALVERDGEIDSEVLEQTQSRLQGHGSNIADATASFEADGNTDAIAGVITDLQESMQTYTDILRSLLAGTSNPEYGAVDDLLASLQQAERIAQSARLDLGLGADFSTTEVPERTDADPYVSIRTPNKYDPIQLGQWSTIRFDHDVREATYILLELFDENKDFVGVISSIDAGQSNNSFRFIPHSVYRPGTGDSQFKHTIEPGTYYIHMSIGTGAEGVYDYKVISGAFEILPSVETNELGKMEVKVVGQMGNPAANIWVRAVKHDTDNVTSELTDERGIATFILPAAKYQVTAYNGEYVGARIDVSLTSDEDVYEVLTVENPGINDYEMPAEIDIVLTDVSLSKKTFMVGEPVTLKYRVTNVGDAIPTNFIHGFDIVRHMSSKELSVSSPKVECNRSSEQPTKDDYCTVWRTLIFKDSGSFNITPSIYLDNAEEENKDNNKVTLYNISVQQEDPDLFVYDVTVSDNTIGAGDEITLSYKLKNLGGKKMLDMHHGVEVSPTNYASSVDVSKYDADCTTTKKVLHGDNVCTITHKIKFEAGGSFTLVPYVHLNPATGIKDSNTLNNKGHISVKVLELNTESVQRADTTASLLQQSLGSNPIAPAGEDVTVAIVRLKGHTDKVVLEDLLIKCEVHVKTTAAGRKYPDEILLRSNDTHEVYARTQTVHSIDAINGTISMSGYFSDMHIVADANSYTSIDLVMRTDDTMSGDLFTTCWTADNPVYTVIKDLTTDEPIANKDINFEFQYETVHIAGTPLTVMDNVMPLPDLAVQDLEIVVTNHNEVHISYEIKNVGDARWNYDVVPFITVYRDGVEGMSLGSHSENNSCYYYNSLPAGHTCHISMTYTSFIEGDFTVKATAANNYAGTTEKSLDNNIAYGIYTISEPALLLPDLIAKDGAIDTDSWTIGSPIELSYIIENIGAIDWPHEVFPVIRVLLDGEEVFYDNNSVDTNSCYVNESLAVGASCDITTTFTPTEAGIYQVEFWAANKRAEPSELDRDNNGWIGEFTIE